MEFLWSLDVGAWSFECGQLDHKRRAFAWAFALGANPPAMHLDNGFTDGQSQAQTFAGAIDLLKSFKDFVEQFVRNTDPGVADLDGD